MTNKLFNNQLLRGWTVTRFLWLVLGLAILIPSVMDKEIVGIILGGYFTAMGVFKIGCQSSTSCCGGNCNTTQKEEK